MKTKVLNKNFKVGQEVVCTQGHNKGEKFVIVLVLADGYSCKKVGTEDGKYYHYDDMWLEKA